jgi:hypothetical protein
MKSPLLGMESPETEVAATEQAEATETEPEGDVVQCNNVAQMGDVYVSFEVSDPIVDKSLTGLSKSNNLENISAADTFEDLAIVILPASTGDYFTDGRYNHKNFQVFQKTVSTQGVSYPAYTINPS